jgi:hypothetical protein
MRFPLWDYPHAGGRRFSYASLAVKAVSKLEQPVCTLDTGVYKGWSRQVTLQRYPGGKEA